MPALLRPRHFAALLLTLCLSWTAVARQFSDSFRDSTLRVDFIISGSPESGPTIAFGEMTKTSGWGGRGARLHEALREGTAEATLTDLTTGDTLYRHTFSTLFQEWLVSGDSVGPRAMEGTVLLPYPREKSSLSISLRDNRRHLSASAVTVIDPHDVLIADHTTRRPLPHTYIYRGENPDSAKISVAILADGYTQAEMPLFHTHAREAVDAILDHEPFSSMAEAFDFIAIESESRQSGVAVPNRGIWPETAFGSHFSTFHSDRYLTSPRVHAMYDAIASTPCHHIIVLANTAEYGGGGIFNFYTLTAAANEKFHPVVVHEFGHSFAGLADEYFYDNEDYAADTYPTDIEPWEPNITTLTDFTAKWKPLVDSGDASLVEGAGYRAKGIWRSARHCRMRSNSAESFCPACRLAIRDTILWLTSQ